MKKLLIVLVLLVVAAVVVAMRSGNQPPAPTVSATQVNDHSTTPAHEGYGMADYVATGRIPAYYETAPATEVCTAALNRSTVKTAAFVSVKL